MQLSRAPNALLTSSSVRKTFLEYFCGEKGHRHVRSSPLLPLGDPSLAFTNAGMNQFKAVLQGTARPPALRVANSQKCVRVGGKHNDLSLVGRDGTHHTFFEMLGNWSFGDYFKAESCSMAWELLTDGYGLDSRRLHVTYFGGDPTLGLEPDLETRDIWRNIGLPENHIKPGSACDNFWEMGDSGPCGGCTEIHYDLGGGQELLELWNLVFVEYNRETSGILKQLNCRHVDTGMGFERLVAVLQGRSSNYDTDLFSPLFETIQRVSGCPSYRGLYGSQDSTGLDTAYRTLADHARMVTLCLADGFFPDQEGKLRGVLRKALTVSRDSFSREEKLLKELSSVIAEMFVDAYPEVGRNLNRVHLIIDHETELLRALRTETKSDWEALRVSEPSVGALSIGECPNLLPAYRRLRSTCGPITSGQALEPAVAWKACETFGVPSHLAGQLATALGMSLNTEALEEEVIKSKHESRKEIYGEELRPGALSPQIIDELTRSGVEPTNDVFKYDYRFGFEEAIKFPDQPASVVALVVDDTLIDHLPAEVIASGVKIGVIADRTNMYSEAGGQCSDSGTLLLQSGAELHVEEVICSGGYVVHWARCKNASTEEIGMDTPIVLKIDSERRLGAMRNHTATHLLNGVLKGQLSISSQKSSRVNSQKLSFDFSVYKESLSLQDLKEIEEGIGRVIRHDVPVRRMSISNEHLHDLHPLTTLPGETYLHSVISVIEIVSGFFMSREPCCGTHVRRTGDLGDFVVTNYKSLSSGVKSIEAVTGERASKARQNAVLFSDLLMEVAKDVDRVLALNDDSQVEICASNLTNFAKLIKEAELLSHVDEALLLETLEVLRTTLKYNARGSLRSSMEAEMKEALKHNTQPYFVHYLLCSSTLDTVPLQKATKLCGNMPCIIFAKTDGLLKARCCVPQHLISQEFSAEAWLGHICKELKAEGAPPRGQNPLVVYNMKGKKVNDGQLETALKLAQQFAETSVA